MASARAICMGEYRVKNDQYCQGKAQGSGEWRKWRKVAPMMMKKQRIGVRRAGRSDSVGAVSDLEDLPVPEGDFGLPIIGHSLEFVKGTKFFEERRDQLGLVFKTSLFGNPTVLVYGIDNIKKVMSMQPPVLKQGLPPSFEKLLGDQAFHVMDGPEHMRIRNIVSSAFKPQAIATYASSIEQEVDRALKEWAETPGSVRFVDKIHDFLYTIAADCIVGLTPAGSSKEELLEMYTAWWDGLISLGIDLPFTKFGKALRARQELVKVIRENIRLERQEGGRENKAIGILLNSSDEDGTTLTDQQLEDTILVIMVASYDTTATISTHLLQNLQNHPQVLEKATAEQKRIVDEYGEEMTMEAVEAMKYLGAVINETLRLDSPVPLGARVAVRSFELNGYRIPEGWHVSLGLGGSSILDERWPGNTEFNPERFLTPEGGKPGGQLAWGIGPHMCMGKAIAVLELKILLAKIMRGYEFSTKSDSVLTVFNQPEDGMPVEFCKKK